ncbi:hypothetical protein HAZT_HAZT000680 [Hyalella azteca]|uniref:NADP-dependent oxidoreductase domain-containing protein n=1 Tax=Hyalella azteca TaxID=294128 RepID=A0A6A0GUW1_HYAAZ|nr:hypothetical protein HAZT_HAZT000680 [Hyalella azteca]
MMLVGTYQIHSKEAIYKVLEAGLASGYRLIDTASGYRNEEHIGAALRDLLPKFGLKREDLFITSKIGPSSAGNHASVVSCCQASLQHLGTTYLDLLLIHWPGLHKIAGEDPRNKAGRLVTWSALQDLYRSGVTRAIGVSNYETRHCREILDSGIVPHVNQVRAASVHRHCRVLPKSTNTDHIAANIAARDLVLSKEQFSLINSIQTRYKYAWDPKNIY